MDRRSQLIDLARETGSVRVDDAARFLGVSAHTIRRDLADLCEAGILERTHGGAVLASRVRNIAHRDRQNTAAKAKEAIAARIAQDVPDGSSLFIGIGTTTEAVATALLAKKGLMILTNNLLVAQILTQHDDARVMVTGGDLRHADCGLVGSLTAQAVRNFRPDWSVLGTSAIEPDGSFLDFDPEEVAVSQAAIASGRKVAIVADAGKLERTAPPARGGHRGYRPRLHRSAFSSDASHWQSQSHSRRARLIRSRTCGPKSSTIRATPCALGCSPSPCKSLPNSAGSSPKAATKLWACKAPYCAASSG